jgi:hypothetical protein
VRKGRCPLNPAPPGALAGALASHEQLQGTKSVESPPGGAAASKLAIDCKLGIRIDFARRALRGSHCEQHQAANQQHTAPPLGRQGENRTSLRARKDEGATKQTKANFKRR